MLIMRSPPQEGGQDEGRGFAGSAGHTSLKSVLFSAPKGGPGLFGVGVLIKGLPNPIPTR